MAARCNQSPRVSQPNRFLARPTSRRDRKQKKTDEGEENYRELLPQDNFYSLLEKSKLPDAEELLAKSEIAIKIGQLLNQKGWTKTEIARRIDLDLPNVSDLLRGRLSSSSIERLQAILKRIEA